jgi:hypothetical protein
LCWAGAGTGGAEEPEQRQRSRVPVHGRLAGAPWPPRRCPPFRR